ncbi:aminotransferase class IV family protein [Halomonas sp. IOP_14]|uniref:aminotransferase class IV family protein n=1 Tax=Halomonas sp. IOP_14 TaxID=2873295 RepID=UPI001E5382CD|nr:aminotransferase class IV family protein [Halomonas sp. IOP_14]MCD1585073.1 aminotransferase class IV family protein [Halomonas sp. IOP_14]
MSVQAATYSTLINGEPASTSDLVPLAFSGFAHFTAMQVRDRKVKGLDLHLTRLREASITLFGMALPDEKVLRSIRLAIAEGSADKSLTVTIYSQEGEFTAKSMGVEPSILVRADLPYDGPSGPVRLSVVEHERHLAEIKHVGEGAKTYYLHRAVEQGFNDAAFVDRRGRLSEATIWNLVFWDGHSVVWPRAEILTGTMMGIVQRQLRRLGVPQRHEEIKFRDVAGFSGAAIMNSWTPGVMITAIGSNIVPEANQFMDVLHEAYQAEPAMIV